MEVARAESPRPRVTSPRDAATGTVKAALQKLSERKLILKKMKKDMVDLIKEEYPEPLKEVSLLLLAMPVTQVSVERLFSALKIYKSDRRNRLKDDILNSLLILKTNK